MANSSPYISDDYKKTLSNMHNAMKWGADGHHHAVPVAKLALKLKAKTILDYGCGQGMLKKRLALVMPRIACAEYDPGIKGKTGLPGPADVVVCTDVLEHIEPERIDEVLRHLRDLTQAGLYLVISCRKAKALLPDGRNAHLIIQSGGDWVKRLEDVFAGWSIRSWNKGKELVVTIIR